MANDLDVTGIYTEVKGVQSLDFFHSALGEPYSVALRAKWWPSSGILEVKRPDGEPLQIRLVGINALEVQGQRP